MRKHRVPSLVAGLFAIGTTTAAAQVPAPSVTELVRGTMAGPITIETTGPSDVVMLKVTHDPAGSGTWHSHPLHFVSVKTGSITIHTGNASGCTSKTYTAGQGFWEPSGAAHIHEGSPDAEVLVTYAGVAPGAALSKDETAPTGPNCPSKLNTGIARTELARGTIQVPIKVTASGDSDMYMSSVTIPPGQVLRDWFSSPAGLFAVQKAGALTIFRGNATTCTSVTRNAGEAIFVPANEPIFVRNDGTTPSEVISTRIGLAVGAAPRVDVANPGGANCPSVAAASTGTPSPSSQLPRTGDPAAELLTLGLGLTAVGTVLRRFSRRR
jgi:quercetin dioxygenase-like cupin family protein